MPYAGAYGWQAAGRSLREIGRRMADRRERERLAKLDEEDRAERRRALQTEELGQPGAMTLEAALPVLNERALTEIPPEPGTREPSAITPESLTRIGRASETDVPIRFRAPPPETLTVGKASRTIQHRAPYLTAAGTVQDPYGASRERMAESAIGTMMSREIGEQPEWQRQGYDSYQKWLDAVRDEARARAEGGMRAARGATPRPTVNQAMEILRDRYAIVGQDPSGRAVVTGYSVPEEEMYAEALEMAGGRPMRPTPIPPLPVAKPIVAAPPPEPEGPGLLSRIGRRIRGAPPMDPTVLVEEMRGKPPTGTMTPPPPAARPVTAGAPPEPTVRPQGGAPAGDLRARAQELRKLHPDWTANQIADELRRQDTR